MFLQNCLTFNGGVKSEVTLVADDTDVLVLMYHWKEHMEDVFFHSEARKSQETTALTLIVRDLVTKA